MIVLSQDDLLVNGLYLLPIMPTVLPSAFTHTNETLTRTHLGF